MKIAIVALILAASLSASGLPGKLNDPTFLGLVTKLKAKAPVVPSNGLLTGLIAYWSFEEPAGYDKIDITGNGWNLVDYTISVNQTPGIITNGIDYNGASGGLRYTGSTPQSVASTNWSVSTWVYVPSGSSSVAVFYQDGVCQFGSNIDSSSLYIYYFRSSDGNSLDTGVSCLMEINGVLPFDQWFHMCFTYDLNTNLVTMYLNGEVLGTSYVGGDWFDVGWPQELEMGYGANGETDYYVGTDFQQDETACWNAVLTPAQVSDLYNFGAGFPYSSFTH